MRAVSAVRETRTSARSASAAARSARGGLHRTAHRPEDVDFPGSVETGVVEVKFRAAGTAGAVFTGAVSAGPGRGLCRGIVVGPAQAVTGPGFSKPCPGQFQIEAAVHGPLDQFIQDRVVQGLPPPGQSLGGRRVGHQSVLQFGAPTAVGFDARFGIIGADSGTAGHDPQGQQDQNSDAYLGQMERFHEDTSSVAGGRGFRGLNLAVTDSRTRWMPAYRGGIRKIPTRVAASMPAKTGVPMARRLAAPGTGGDDQGKDAEDE